MSGSVNYVPRSGAAIQADLLFEFIVEFVSAGAPPTDDLHDSGHDSSPSIRTARRSYPQHVNMALFFHYIISRGILNDDPRFLPVRREYLHVLQEEIDRRLSASGPPSPTLLHSRRPRIGDDFSLSTSPSTLPIISACRPEKRRWKGALRPATGRLHLPVPSPDRFFTILTPVALTQR